MNTETFYVVNWSYPGVPGKWFFHSRHDDLQEAHDECRTRNCLYSQGEKTYEVFKITREGPFPTPPHWVHGVARIFHCPRCEKPGDPGLLNLPGTHTYVTWLCNCGVFCKTDKITKETSIVPQEPKRIKSLDGRGRCCGRKPLVYKTGNFTTHRQPCRFCSRCGTSYHLTENRVL